MNFTFLFSPKDIPSNGFHHAIFYKTFYDAGNTLPAVAGLPEHPLATELEIPQKLKLFDFDSVGVLILWANSFVLTLQSNRIAEFLHKILTTLFILSHFVSTSYWILTIPLFNYGHNVFDGITKEI